MRGGGIWGDTMAQHNTQILLAGARHFGDLVCLICRVNTLFFDYKNEGFSASKKEALNDAF